MKNRIKLFLAGKKLPDYDNQWSNFHKSIAWILLISFLNLATGCMNYFMVTNPKGSIDKEIHDFSNQNKTIIIHLDDKAWVLKSPELSDNKLKGTTEEFHSILNYNVRPNKSNRYRNIKTNDQSAVLNEVHIYIKEMDVKQDSYVSIPLSSIEKVDVYEKDKNATIGSWALGCIGGGILGSGLFLLIWLLTKSSCPFIYVPEGENYALISEIYNGSVQKAIERHDFLKLPALKNNGQKEFKIKIANEVKEIQNTNLLELWTFDHNKELEVAVDKYGNYHTLSNLKSPDKAFNLKGTDVSGIIGTRDSMFYSGMEISGDMPVTDGIIMEFENPLKADTAKLVVRAKNSVMLDYMIGQFYDMFSIAFKTYMKKQEKASPEALLQWFHKQNLFLSLSVERNGIWENVDYFNIAGPVAMKEDILAIPLNGNESNPLRVKLEYGNYFWEIDYAGIDFSQDKKIDFKIVNPITAINQSGDDVTKNLFSDDKLYYSQPNVGDYADITYNIPELTGEKQTFYLHSKGWYKILRTPQGKPDIKKLEAFRQPGYFNKFVNDYISSFADDNTPKK